jgi:hypothetical protein
VLWPERVDAPGAFLVGFRAVRPYRPHN